MSLSKAWTSGRLSMDKLRVRYDVVEMHGETCLFYGCRNRADQLHHAIIRNYSKPAALHTLLFSVENLVPACQNCNVGRVGDNANYHHLFWLAKCEVFGEGHMIGWLEQVNEQRKVELFTPDLEPPDFIAWLEGLTE